MRLSLTIFNSRYDNKTHKVITKRNWKEFKNFFYKLQEIQFTKQNAPLICPAVFDQNTTRSSNNVTAWAGWSAFDIDHHPFKTKEDIFDHFVNEYAIHSSFCIYSTPSSTIQTPKFRVVFPLSSWITDKNDIRHFWFAMNKKMKDLVDQQTKDLARMFYPPADYKESNNKFLFFHDADSDKQLDWKIIIEESGITSDLLFLNNQKIMDRIPDKMKIEVQKYRRRQLEQDGKYYAWTSFEDCPFVDKKLVEEYRKIALTDLPGRYRMYYSLIVSVIGNAIKKNHPITEYEVEELVREIDLSIDGYYKNRKIKPEIENAMSYIYTNQR